MPHVIDVRRLEPVIVLHRLDMSMLATHVVTGTMSKVLKVKARPQFHSFSYSSASEASSVLTRPCKINRQIDMHAHTSAGTLSSRQMTSLHTPLFVLHGMPASTATRTAVCTTASRQHPSFTAAFHSFVSHL